ncbi:hypothetical protein PP175_26285 (plasmid) [Aneurinibacillus sp. Ricciae_BoGa-3]|uniref:hypothetical protein n=1 Tax=Aneurinibacillus sp. Ricciae_BoGa-3 TaxID=3022697 RepID=UPI0023409199|nr:hypothetical protein [Aneurinibacillus sp. Ricciae_BoGa-3]WCK57576.1 hypothetical protein PP175_26285 [Aneurinibacillus sp. Ricciae_BoGa-3]
MNYLKAYTTYTFGTPAGRDDGYPYTAYQVFEDMESLVKEHEKRENERYFLIEEVNTVAFLEKIKAIQKVLKEKEEEVIRAKKMAELEKLKKELNME